MSGKVGPDEYAEYMVPELVRGAFERGYMRGVGDGLKASRQMQANIDTEGERFVREIKERASADQ